MTNHKVPVDISDILRYTRRCSANFKQGRHMSDSTDSKKSSRLREHPKQRFDHAAIGIDLQKTADKLRQEPDSGEKGHRQQTLYRGDGYTVALFAFDKFTRLKEHKAKGIVNIHVLRGQLKVTADGQVHQLSAGQMLVLAPDVLHDVVAEQESEMLLSVHLAN